MLALSNILMQGHGIDSFSALKEVLRERVRTEGVVFLQFDVRPPFNDTPDDWQEQLEAVFIDRDIEPANRGDDNSGSDNLEPANRAAADNGDDGNSDSDNIEPANRAAGDNNNGSSDNIKPASRAATGDNGDDGNSSSDNQD